MKTVINKKTGEVLRCQFDDVIGDGEMLIEKLLTESMQRPFFIDGKFIDKNE